MQIYLIAWKLIGATLNEQRNRWTCEFAYPKSPKSIIFNNVLGITASHCGFCVRSYSSVVVVVSFFVFDFLFFLFRFIFYIRPASSFTLRHIVLIANLLKQQTCRRTSKPAIPNCNCAGRLFYATLAVGGPWAASQSHTATLRLAVRGINYERLLRASVIWRGITVTL